MQSSTPSPSLSPTEQQHSPAASLRGFSRHSSVTLNVGVERPALVALAHAGAARAAPAALDRRRRRERHRLRDALARCAARERDARGGARRAVGVALALARRHAAADRRRVARVVGGARVAVVARRARAGSCSSDGHAIETPSQSSARSHAPAAARHERDVTHAARAPRSSSVCASPHTHAQVRAAAHALQDHLSRPGWRTSARLRLLKRRCSSRSTQRADRPHAVVRPHHIPEWTSQLMCHAALYALEPNTRLDLTTLRAGVAVCVADDAAHAAVGKAQVSTTARPRRAATPS